MEPVAPTQKNIPGDLQQEEDYPAWMLSSLTTILVVTISGDIFGNLLVILSVFRNKKLRKAGKPFHPTNVIITVIFKTEFLVNHLLQFALY